MTTSESLPFFRLPRLQFSLAALFLMLTVAAVGFGTWWRMPWQIAHLPEELTGRRPTENPKGMLYCGTGIDYAALWVERVPRDLRDRPDAFNAEKPVYAMTGKCWVRRDWQKPWVLDGRAAANGSFKRTTAAASCTVISVAGLRTARSAKQESTGTVKRMVCGKNANSCREP